MKIHHEVQILNQKTRYYARVLDAKIHVTVPRIVWHNGTAHLVSRQELISDLPTVLKVYEHIDDRQPFDAWRLIGQHINDVYLQGVK